MSDTLPPSAAAAPGEQVRRPTIESHAIDYISEEERHGSVWRQAAFWFVPNFNFFSIALGFIGPSLGLSLLWTVVAGAAGALFGGFFVSFHASQGPKLGLPQMIQSRAQFGYRGVLVPTVVVLFSFMVFNVLQTDVIQTGLHGIWGWNQVTVATVVSVLAAVLAIYGHDWLHRVFRVLFIVSIPLFLVLTIGIAAGAAGGSTTSGPSGGFTVAAFMAVFAAAASYNITLAPDVSDYTRYLPSKTPTRYVVVAVQAGVCVSLVWLMGVGAWLASRTGATDGLVSLNASGNHIVSHFGTVLAMLSAVALIAVIGINTYSAVLSVATILDCFRPVKSTAGLRIGIAIVLLIVWRVVGINLGSDQTTLINNGLNILLYLLVPWTAVNLVDFFLVRRGHYAIAELFDRDGLYGRWSWRGLVAYAIGLAAEVPFMQLTFYHSPGARALTNIDIAFIVGLIISGGAYLLFARSLDLDSEESAIEQSNEILAEGINPEEPEFREDPQVFEQQQFGESAIGAAPTPTSVRRSTNA